MSTAFVILDQAAVRALLTADECIDIVESALGRLASGSGQQPVRQSLVSLGGHGVLALMPAELTEPAVLGYKAVTVFHGNRERDLPTHQATIALVDPETGRMIALIDGTFITELRTAAVSAVATRHLADPAATTLAILGTGVQAQSHIETIIRVRPIERIAIWGRRLEEAERLADEARAPGRPEVIVARTVAEAVEDAAIIVTATSSTEPILGLAPVRPGAHINAVGSCFPHARELAGELVAASVVFVDDRAAAAVEAGDLLLAAQDGLIGPDHVRGELGEVIGGAVPGRTNAEEITLFESLGLGVEDIAVAAVVVRRAIERGVGTRASI